MNITITGGGTGGHLFPAIAVAQEFQRRGAGHVIQFIGSSRGIEARVLPRAGYLLETVEIRGFAGKRPLGKVESLASIVPSVARARALLRAFGSQLVIGFGGYISFPAVIAGRMLGLPVAVHEQNSVPGLSNRVLALFARRIFVTYEESMRFFPARKTIYSGLPLRALPARELDAGRTDASATVCILGGSQGAREINSAVIGALPAFAQSAAPLRFIHQTGAQDTERVEAAYRQHGLQACVAPFFDDMLARFLHSDLVIARAGAGTLAELAVCGLPAILIPYPFAAGDHQRKNARMFERQGAALVLDSRDLSSDVLARSVLDLIGAPGRLQDMARQARQLAQPRAAQIIVDECCRLAAA
ncbi:MAG: undecaprenyldiphospho-muramoylpentapeptide beta-N-acetylglucosaminyltransferase [Deltaproteobacteria bacterium]|nr:undecaprenyldiphospho-muramoylpentapeptide beta-N-acetylglucosaminyltransferase [Deltaproteobacteria bacterium]